MANLIQFLIPGETRSAVGKGSYVRASTKWGQALDCDKYLRNYLSAHADFQLSPGQRRAAELHVRECRACEMSLFEERSVKALVRNTLGIVLAPTEVKKQIRKRLREHTERN